MTTGFVNVRMWAYIYVICAITHLHVHRPKVCVSPSTYNTLVFLISIDGVTNVDNCSKLPCILDCARISLLIMPIIVYSMLQSCLVAKLYLVVNDRVNILLRCKLQCVLGLSLGLQMSYGYHWIVDLRSRVGSDLYYS